MLADRRFQKKRSQLPKWISQALLESDTNLSTDMAVAAAKKFLRTMAQPFGGRDQEGISTWSLADLERHKEKMDDEKIREFQNGQVEGSNGVGVGVEMGGMDDDEFGNGDIDDQAMLDLEG